MGATDLSVLPQRQVVFPETVFRSGAVGDIPLRVEAITGQTGNLQEWRDANGYATSYITGGGALVVRGTTGKNEAIVAGGPLYAGQGGAPAYFDSTLSLMPTSASVKGIVVRGMASQTANLQEWQNSAGATLSSVAPSGWISAPGFAVNGGDIQFVGTTRRTIYPVTAGNIDLQIRSGGTGILQLNADNNGPVYFGGGMVTMQGSLKIIQDTVNQGNSGLGLLVGNDLWIYDVNIANAIGFSGASNPEAATIVLGRAGNSGPRLAGNDVNKTLHLYGGVSQGQGTVTALTSFRVESGYGVNGGTDFEITNGGVTTGNAHSAFMRMVGPGVAHGDVTWHPSERYFRFRTTVSAAFDGWASILALQFLSQSTGASKENIQTLEVGGTTTAKRVGSGRAPLSERFKNLRPVSYTTRGRADSPTLHSFVAEEAYEAVPEIVALDGEGKPAGIDLMATISILTAMVQEQQTKIEELERRLK